MARKLTYNEEMERLRKLLEEVSTDEESIEENDAFSDCDEMFSEHDTSSEEEIESDEEDAVESNSDDCFTGKDGKTIWKKTKFRQNFRTLARNIISKLPGNIGEAKDVTSPIESWNLLLDENILNTIVTCTNIYIDTISGNFQRERDANKTELSEIKAFIGLLYLCGIHKSSHVHVRDLWRTDGMGLEIFHRTMSHNRFLFLIRCIRFDDVRDRQIRKEVDKLAPIRYVFDSFVHNCQKLYIPGSYVTIDEKLEPFRGRCSFRQYMPKKPARYGIKIFALVDARTFYTCKLEVYTGTQPQGPYHVNNSSVEVVKRLTENLNSGRNVTVDNWYTSYELAKYLLQKNITLVGTIRKNKREIPKEFVNNKNRKVHSSLFAFQKDMTLVSYVPKKNKFVNLLSTMHNDDAIDQTTGEAKKPEIITFYNLTKGAVDVVDQMSAAYSTARISNRWPMVLFYTILNTAAINSRVLLQCSKHPSLEHKKRSHFLRALATDLLKEHTAKRSTVTCLPRHLQEKLASQSPPAKKQKVAERKRCYICPSSKDRKSKISCIKCEKNVCGEHSVFTCINCT